jgi:hypothetical protein
MCADGVHDPFGPCATSCAGTSEALKSCPESSTDGMTEERSEIVQRARLVQVHDRLAVERWISEGGHIAPEAVIERETAPGNAEPDGATRQRHRVGEPTSKIAPSFHSQGANP